MARLLELAAVAPLALLSRPRDSTKGGARKRIVLLEPFQLGDVLSLAVMFDPLKAKMPDCEIVLWCHSKNAHVFRNDPRVARVIHAPFPWASYGSKRGSLADWRLVVQSVTEIRALRPEIGIDCRGEVRNQVLLRAGNCRRRIGFRNYLATNMVIRGLHLTENLGLSPRGHRYEMNLRLLQPLLGAVPALQLPSLVMAEIAPRRRSSASERQLVIHIGAPWVHRRWPAERWATVIDDLGSRPGVSILMVSGPNEEPLVREVLARIHVSVDWQSTTFEELVAAIKSADLFIAVDSGPMNLAVALGIKTLALFGPGNMEVWAPLGKDDAWLGYGHEFPCHPCLQKRCVVPDADCISRIQVNEVRDAVLAIVGLTQPGLSQNGRRASS